MSATSLASHDAPNADSVVIGIDVGGTGIKGAAIKLSTGTLMTGRHKVQTPQGGRPAEIVAVVSAMVIDIRAELSSRGIACAPQIGVCVPAVVRHGVTHTAANIDPSWIGLAAEALFARAFGAPCTLINDADAAGIAEARLGAAASTTGVVLVLTLGTGLGSALLHNGVLVPNTELGHLELDGQHPVERYVSPKIIRRDGVPLSDWALRLNRVLQHIETLFSPELFVLGGSISASAAEFLPLPGVRTTTIPAKFLNNAGILGAALHASVWSGSV